MNGLLRTILLTGATGAIGRRLAQEFLSRGHTLIATSRRGAALDAMRNDVAGLPGTFVPLEVDLLSVDLGALVSDLANHGLSPHHLINNARDIVSLRLPADGWPTTDQWRAEFELGVVVPANLTIALADDPRGVLRSVVNVGSMYGIVAMNTRLYENASVQAPAHYGVVKAALLQLTKEFAVRLAPRGIRVNAISYGGVEGRADDKFKSRYGEFVPNGRMLTLDDVFTPVEFLLYTGPDAMTGHNLIVDGGWTLW